jgi:hypothetical protein
LYGSSCDQDLYALCYQELTRIQHAQNVSFSLILKAVPDVLVLRPIPLDSIVSSAVGRSEEALSLFPDTSRRSSSGSGSGVAETAGPGGEWDALVGVPERYFETFFKMWRGNDGMVETCRKAASSSSLTAPDGSRTTPVSECSCLMMGLVDATGMASKVVSGAVVKRKGSEGVCRTLGSRHANYMC